MKKIILLLGICGLYQITSAQDLLEIYNDTLQFNPSYKANIEESEAQGDLKEEARSAFLPHISTDASYGRTSSQFDTGPLPYLPDLPALPESYHEHGVLKTYDISLEQEIFDYSSWKALGAAKFLGEASKLKVEDEKQALTFKVANEYFNTLREQQKLKFLSAEKTNLLNEKKTAENKYKTGTGIKLAIDEINYYLQAIDVETLSIQNNITNSFNQLSSISGKPVTQIFKLTTNMPITLPAPDNFLSWKKTADIDNNAIRASSLKVNAAQEKIGMESSKWMPRVFAEANYGYETTNVPVFQSLSAKTASAFLGIQMPISTGGYNSAKTAEVTHQYQQYSYELDNAKQELDLAVKEILQDINTLYVKLKVDKSKIDITNQALAANLRAYKIGVKNIDESLTMQDKLIAAQNAYADDFYNYILLKLKLKQLAGELNANTIIETNQFLRQN